MFKEKLTVNQQEKGSFSSKDAHLSWELNSDEANVLDHIIDIKEEDGFLERLSSLKAEIQYELTEKIYSLKDSFRYGIQKVQDLIPETVIKALEDRVFEKYVKTLSSGVDASKMAGMVFNSLALKRLHAPTQENNPKIREHNKFELLLEEHELFKNNRNKMRRLKYANSLRNILYKTIPVELHEEKNADTDKGYHTFQTFSQQIKTQDNKNIIHESINNYLITDEPNFCTASLQIHNLSSKKALDFRLLIPEDYVLAPSQIVGEYKLEKLADGKRRTQEKIVPVSNNLMEYQGTQAEDDSFFHRGDGKIGYGNLTAKGGMLSLLHEIAHAWHCEYRPTQARAELKDFYNDLTKIMEPLYIAQKTGIDKEANSGEDSELKTGVREILNEYTEQLANMGAELGSTNSTVENKDEYTLVAMDNIKIRTEKLRPMIEEFVAQERDAWAHAIKILRLLRDQGIDLEPSMKTPKDISEYIHYCLGSYQYWLEEKLIIPNTIKSFTHKKL